MDKVLARLDHILSVQDIMTPADDLERATSIGEARRLFSQYDVVPYPRSGNIRGFFQRGLDKRSALTAAYLISDTTSLLNMPHLLAQPPFRFVISADEITGYVHYSDLNEPTMKVPLFVLIQAMEKKLWDSIADRITEEIVYEVFPNDAQLLINKRKTSITGNVDIGWIGVLTLPRILRLANHFELTNFSGDQIKSLRSTRNDVSHSDENLIDNYSDVSRLAEVVKLCQSVLKSKFK